MIVAQKRVIERPRRDSRLDLTRNGPHWWHYRDDCVHFLFSFLVSIAREPCISKRRLCRLCCWREFAGAEQFFCSSFRVRSFCRIACQIQPNARHTTVSYTLIVAIWKRATATTTAE